jgi:hypothetical protein
MRVVIRGGVIGGCGRSAAWGYPISVRRHAVTSVERHAAKELLHEWIDLPCSAGCDIDQTREATRVE